ncbi:hypothetical protein TB1_028292 [Malus domestica]
MTCILPTIRDACHVVANNNVLACHDARHIALLRGGKPVDKLELRDHEGKVPEHGDVDMTDQEEEKDDNAEER